MIIAHQGGWDEVGFVIIPLAIIAGLLTIANRRANSIAKARAKMLLHGDDPPQPLED